MMARDAHRALDPVVSLVRHPDRLKPRDTDVRPRSSDRVVMEDLRHADKSSDGEPLTPALKWVHEDVDPVETWAVPGRVVPFPMMLTREDQRHLYPVHLSLTGSRKTHGRPR